jgi:acyl-CoA synthetase (AMP-forming)/AMP-acid ligase II
VTAVRDRLPAVRLWIWVGGGAGPCPGWATSYDDAVAARPVDQRPWGRSGDDLYLLYTGGTTGVPKGVMWRVDDIVALLNATSLGVTYPEDGDLDDVRRLLTAPGPVGLPASPLMHGTGAFTAFSMLDCGGSVVLLEGRSFDPVELLDAIARERVEMVGLVGDPFCRPIVRALDEHPARWDLSSLVGVVSSGALWSGETKKDLLRHLPGVQLTDALTASEAPGMGVSSDIGGFVLGGDARVLDDSGRDVAPGSDTIGRLAVAGRVPLGYYNDPEKTAQTFITLDGRRYAMPGDHATVTADGTLVLLGRGSLCINTGGEKVFPAEVEEALLHHPDVVDAAVVGLPDERLGEVVVAVVELADGVAAEAVDLASFVRRRLAAYKAPRHVVALHGLGRAANGKVDYLALRSVVEEKICKDMLTT